MQKNYIPFDESIIWLTKFYPESMIVIATTLGKMRSRIRPTNPKTYVIGYLNVPQTEGSLGWEKIRAAEEVEIVLAIKQDGRTTATFRVILVQETKALSLDAGDGVRQDLDSTVLMAFANKLVDEWQAGQKQDVTPPGRTLDLPMPPKTRER